MNRYRLGLIEDQTILRETLVYTLSSGNEIEVVGNWGDAESALESLAKIPCDIVLADYILPGMHGIAFTRKALELHPRLKVILISCAAGEELIFEAFQAGVSGYLHKEISIQEMLNAIRAVSQGELVLSNRVISRFIRFCLDRAKVPREESELSMEEKEVLRLAGLGLANKEIAFKMDLPLTTVKLRIRTAIKKLNACDRTHAVTKAISMGLIGLDS